MAQSLDLRRLTECLRCLCEQQPCQSQHKTLGVPSAPLRTGCARQGLGHRQQGVHRAAGGSWAPGRDCTAAEVVLPPLLFLRSYNLLEAAFLLLEYKTLTDLGVTFIQTT